VLFNISMPADATKELERKIRFLEPVMRQMLTVV
jgi:ribosomal protein S6